MSDLKSVLIVDDSALSRMMIRGFIEKKYPECVVYEAPTGDVAIEVAAVQAPQLITLDVNMPGMDSFEAASQLHKLCPSARMAVITANIQQSVRKKLQGLGILFLAIVEKPVTEGGIQRILDAM
jgi:two-component system chemotaxis response regulator CheY